jgi:hypothetical protein
MGEIASSSASTTSTPLYFTSFADALLPAHDFDHTDYGEVFLSHLEVPWPWDRTCTSMGVCPQGARCGRTSGFAIICSEGTVREAAETVVGWLMPATTAKVVAAWVVLVCMPVLWVVGRWVCGCGSQQLHRRRRRGDVALRVAGNAETTRNKEGSEEGEGEQQEREAAEPEQRPARGEVRCPSPGWTLPRSRGSLEGAGLPAASQGEVPGQGAGKDQEEIGRVDGDAQSYVDTTDTEEDHPTDTDTASDTESESEDTDEYSLPRPPKLSPRSASARQNHRMLFSQSAQAVSALHEKS